MTTHLDTELDRLKNEIEEMGSLVRNQLGKSIDAFIGAKKELAKEVLFQERRVNAEELKIDRDCENIMVLFNPVAIDLRLVFAAFKINSHLERMGDHAKGIAAYASKLTKPYAAELLTPLQLREIVDHIDDMIASNLRAFKDADTSSAREIFRHDDRLDEWNKKAITVIGDYIRNHTDEVEGMLNLASVVRKMERIGDLNKNIAEEIIFYVEANVLKHEKEKI
ncbi:MAG: phosphate signaling complex protein PhoU [Chitinophagales bacterium]|nr:phosphate signaling complex protein PhoU [Bacteroidota bacterium]MBX7141647.1 phosphate signaling complex protein PhoU [Chitinophagales bacterium]